MHTPHNTVHILFCVMSSLAEFRKYPFGLFWGLAQQPIEIEFAQKSVSFTYLSLQLEFAAHTKDVDVH